MLEIFPMLTEFNLAGTNGEIYFSLYSEIFRGRLVEPFSAQVPWMVAVGNHEIADLFLAYLYRFRMPGRFR